MLDRRALEQIANFVEQGIALLAFDAVEFDLDEFVRGQSPRDLLGYGSGQTIAGDTDDRMQMMRGGPQSAAPVGSEFDHGGIVA